MAAQQMGLEVLIGSRGEHSLTTEVNQGLHIDLDDHDAALAAILEEARYRPFPGVIGSDDSTVELAAHAASLLGLPHNPPQAARLTRRKDLSREHLMLAGCPVPIHCLVDVSKPLADQTAGLPWPCVVKPLNMSASRGVIRANDEAGFNDACARIRDIIAESGDDFERKHVLVEYYIDGVEVAYEGYLHEGVLHTLAVFDKPDPMAGPYFEETIYVTPSTLDADTLSMIKLRVQQACTAFGLRTGPVHAELRVNAQDAWLLEVASRTIGGDCARTLDSGTSKRLEQMTVSLAIGEPVEPEAIERSRGVMMIPIRQAGLLRRVEGILAAQKVPHVEKIDITISEGHELVPLPEGNQYLGFIFAQADTPQQVTAALRQAHEKLTFVTAPVFKLAKA
ncbi:MAG: ATP-grasp domain-containing protein [Gammaproteobacteria bacterium]|nr:ATP-grasp domain-containing protein [Gammaproteobacteria bacterium]